MAKTRSTTPQPPKKTSTPKQKKSAKKKPQKQAPNKKTISRQTLRKTILANLSKRPRKNLYGRVHPSKVVKEQFNTPANIQKFNCPICLELMILPCLSECGHAFCLPCLEQSLRHKHACSLCRQPLTFEQFKRSTLIQGILRQIIVSALDQSELEEYKKRKQLFLEQDQAQRVDPEVTEGDVVDFYMEEQWRQGTVIRKEETDDEQILLILQSTQEQDLTRSLPLSSRLLAKRHTYTKQKVQLQTFVGQLRLITNSIVLGRGTNQIELYPITLRPHQLGSGGDVMRIVFTFSPNEDP